MEEMLRADNITFSYTDDQHRAVDGLSLRVKRGEYVAVLGANGCGKSTLAKHFNAILLPQAGTVYVEDMSTADEDKLFDIRQKVGMVIDIFSCNFEYGTFLKSEIFTVRPFSRFHTL